MFDKLLEFLLPNIFGDEQKHISMVRIENAPALSRPGRFLRAAECDFDCLETTIIESGKITITRRQKGNFRFLGANGNEQGYTD